MPEDEHVLGATSQELIDFYEANKDTLNTAMVELDDIYGADQLAKPTSRTFTEYIYRKFHFGKIHADTPEGQEIDWGLLHKLRATNLVQTTRGLQHALEILKDEYGVDIIGDRKQLASNPDLYKATMEGLAEVTTNRGDVYGVAEELLGYTYAKDIVNLFGNNKATFRNSLINTQQAAARISQTDQPALRLAAYSQETFYQNTIRDISAMRYDAHHQLKRLFSPEIDMYLDFTERYVATAKNEKPNTEVIESILDSQKQELDYTILPAGTTLESVARLIVDESSEATKPSIDLQRLTVLEEVRQLFGPENCYLMRGKKTGKEMADEDGTLISEDYIGLIMQHHDSDGNVMREDCLAISPIAHKHAGYIVRQDASAGISWREVLSLPKADAIKYFNARRLRFDPVTGEDKYEAYVKKAVALLTCEPDYFGPDYRLRRKNEDYELIFRPQNFGKIGIQGAQLTELLAS